MCHYFLKLLINQSCKAVSGFIAEAALIRFIINKQAYNLKHTCFLTQKHHGNPPVTYPLEFCNTAVFRPD